MVTLLRLLLSVTTVNVAALLQKLVDSGNCHKADSAVSRGLKNVHDSTHAHNANAKRVASSISVPARFPSRWGLSPQGPSHPVPGLEIFGGIKFDTR